MKKIFITLAMMMLLEASNLFAQEITPGKEIDLGLPSGTIWAGWNIGATSPEEYGDYYAWGETTTKGDYSEATYKYWNKKFINIGSNISGTKYDVARQKWGGSWRMPTKAEMYELTTKCKWTLCKYKGVSGYKVVGPNGNSIFLPAAGYRLGTSLRNDGIFGYYWSASLYEDDRYYTKAWYLYICDIYYRCLNGTRRFGHSVRPVK